MTNALQVLNYNGTEIRTVEIDGDTWWVAKDLAETLDYGSANDATRILAEDEKGTHLVRTPGGEQRMQIVNEPGLYALIRSSTKPEAKAFDRWIRWEVLPQINRQGFYLPKNLSIERKELMALDLRREALLKQIEAKELLGKAEFILQVDGGMPIIDWIDANHPELNQKQRSNLSRSIKRCLNSQLKCPVGYAKRKGGGKVASATAADIEAAVELLRETRKELIKESN